MIDFVIRRDIPTQRPKIPSIYGEIIENMVPGDSLLIKRRDQKSILMFIARKYKETREYQTITFEENLYLQRLK